MTFVRLALFSFALLFLSSCDSEKPEQTVQQDIVPTIAMEDFTTLVTGAWISTSDDKSVLTFGKEGITSEYYDGEPYAHGDWRVVLESTSPTGLVLKKTIEGEDYVFSVLAISEDQLSLSYLPRGNTLTYNRKK